MTSGITCCYIRKVRPSGFQARLLELGCCKMQFHVLGLGSVGTFLAHHLRRAIPIEYPITLIHKTRAQVEQTIAAGNIVRLEQNGIPLPAVGFKLDAFAPPHPGKRHHHKITTENDNTKNFHSPIESLFVTTKAQQALPAIQQLAPRLNAHSTIVLLQNGMGLYEELANQVFRNADQRPHFILASNTHGIFTKGFHHVVHTGVGNINFGIMPDPLGRNFEASLANESIPRSERKLQLTDITTPEDPHFSHYKSLRDTVAALVLLQDTANSIWRPMHEMQVQLRRKLVVNAVINPLTAIMNCRNGDIFISPAAKRILHSVCVEASLAFTREFQAETNEWINTLKEQGGDIDSVDAPHLPYALTKEALEEEVLKVANATKGNISSMLSDIRRGNDTEIAYINGYLLSIGSTYGVSMPVNAMLQNLVHMRSNIPLDQTI